MPMHKSQAHGYAGTTRRPTTDGCPSCYPVRATIAFMTASWLPYAVWIMKNFMDGVPISLEAAARTDGPAGSSRCGASCCR